jgi:hypothetical protein
MSLDLTPDEARQLIDQIQQAVDTLAQEVSPPA